MNATHINCQWVKERNMGGICKMYSDENHSYKLSADEREEYERHSQHDKSCFESSQMNGRWGDFLKREKGGKLTAGD